MNIIQKNQEKQGIYTQFLLAYGDKHKDKVEIIKGKLYYATKDRKEIKWLQEMGIEPNPYDIVDGELLSSDGNLLLVDEETGSLTIPGSVTKIGEGAFANVEGLKTIIIPGTCKEIGKNAFNGNKTLENVIMLDGVEKIGSQAFKDCTKLKTVQMANTVTELGGSVFFGDFLLEKVNISYKLETISSHTFHNCRSLKEITLPEGIKSIQSASFSNCIALQSINIPKSMTTIEGTAFNGDNSLTSIVVDPQNTNFEFKNGILLGNNKQEMCIILESAITSNVFTVPEGITKLKNDQLGSFSKIDTVEIPSTVTSISALFFSNNIKKINIDSRNNYYESDGKAVYTKGKENLVRYYANESTVTINEKVYNIQAYAFKAQDNITQINLPDTVSQIAGEVFTGCSKLTSLHLGKNVYNFNNMSIYGSSIENVTIDEDNPNYSIVNGALYSKDGTVFISPLKKIGNITTYEIPNGVKRIADNAFHNQNKMTSIILPNTLEKIGNSFNVCTSLTTIEIPNSVNEINTSCFANCGDNLKQIIINKPKGSIPGSPWGCIYGDRAVIWKE